MPKKLWCLLSQKCLLSLTATKTITLVLVAQNKYSMAILPTLYVLGNYKCAKGTFQNSVVKILSQVMGWDTTSLTMLNRIG